MTSMLKNDEKSYEKNNNNDDITNQRDEYKK